MPSEILRSGPAARNCTLADLNMGCASYTEACRKLLLKKTKICRYKQTRTSADVQNFGERRSQPRGFCYPARKKRSMYQAKYDPKALMNISRILPDSEDCGYGNPEICPVVRQVRKTWSIYSYRPAHSTRGVFVPECLTHAWDLHGILC